MASTKPPEDTQPRVVLDEAALKGQQEDEGQVIVSGVLEDSSPSRPRSPRRPRSSATGIPSVARGPASARNAPRPARSGEDAEEPPEQDDSGPVHIEIEDGGEVAPRDPREDTRKTPLPTRPGEKSRRAQRDEPSRAAEPASARKRSWGWMVGTFLLLVVAGAATVVAAPRLERLWKQFQEPETRPTPALPIPRKPPPSGPPGMVPPAAPPSTAAPAAGAPGEAATATGTGDKPPAGTSAAPATPQKAAVPAEDDIFVPLPNTPQPAATPKKTPPRSTKKAARSRDAIELQKEWGQVRGLYQKLTQEQSCESPKLGLLCSKYDALKADIAELGDGYDKDINDRVKKMRKSLQNQLNANP
jgi:serine/threonine-protein kinase